MMVRNISINLVFLALSIFMLFASYQLPGSQSTVELGPGFYPRMIIFILIILNIIDIAIKIINDKKEQKEQGNLPAIAYGKLLIMIIVMSSYILSLKFVDYRIATFLLVYIIMLIIDKNKYKQALFVAIGFVLTIYVIFDYLLRIPMP